MKALWSTVLMLFVGVALAQPTERFREANALYANGDYQSAMELYAQIESDQWQSAALYYNMANAYYKMGQMGKSIQYYHKALKLNPHYEEAKQNLRLAELSTIDRFEQMPEPMLTSINRGIFQLFTPSAWAFLSLFLLLLCLAGTAMYFFSRLKRLGFIGGLVALGLSLLFLLNAWQHYNYRQDRQPAVVLVPSSYVKSGPASNAEDVFILHEGTYLQVTEAYEDWRKVRLPDGKIGWMRLSELGMI